MFPVPVYVRFVAVMVEMLAAESQWRDMSGGTGSIVKQEIVIATVLSQVNRR